MASCTFSLTPSACSALPGQEELVGVWPVEVGGVEQGDAGGDGVVDELHHVRLGLGRAVGEGHAHAAQAQPRHLQPLRPPPPTTLPKQHQPWRYDSCSLSLYCLLCVFRQLGSIRMFGDTSLFIPEFILLCHHASSILPKYRIGSISWSIEINCIFYLFSTVIPVRQFFFGGKWGLGRMHKADTYRPKYIIIFVKIIKFQILWGYIFWAYRGNMGHVFVSDITWPCHHRTGWFVAWNSNDRTTEHCRIITHSSWLKPAIIGTVLHIILDRV